MTREFQGLVSYYKTGEYISKKIGGDTSNHPVRVVLTYYQILINHNKQSVGQSVRRISNSDFEVHLPLSFYSLLEDL